jgi:hypothetical protein
MPTKVLSNLVRRQSIPSLLNNLQKTILRLAPANRLINVKLRDLSAVVGFSQPVCFQLCIVMSPTRRLRQKTLTSHMPPATAPTNPIKTKAGSPIYLVTNALEVYHIDPDAQITAMRAAQYAGDVMR